MNGFSEIKREEYITSSKKEKHMTMIQAHVPQQYTALSAIDKAYIADYLKAKINGYELEARLREWGTWLAKSLEGGLGYPAQNTLVTARQGSPGTTLQPTPENAHAEQVNRAYLVMKEIHPDWATVLSVEYAEDKVTKDEMMSKPRKESQAQRAARLGLSRAFYIQKLNLAKTFVEARITYI